jgi:hypothetical protein
MLAAVGFEIVAVDFSQSVLRRIRVPSALSSGTSRRRCRELGQQSSQRPGLGRPQPPADVRVDRDRLGDEDVTDRPAAVGEVDLGDVPA